MHHLESNGIRRVILGTGYGHKKIKKWVRSSYNGILEIIFSREKKPLGTAGAIKYAQHLIKSDDFFIINGDTLFNISLQSFYKFHLK